jgi:hypothetical protein
VINPDALFKGLSDHGGEPKLNVWMSHGDHVSVAPPASPSPPPPTAFRWPPWPTKKSAGTACSSTRK